MSSESLNIKTIKYHMFSVNLHAGSFHWPGHHFLGQDRCIFPCICLQLLYILLNFLISVLGTIIFPVLQTENII